MNVREIAALVPMSRLLESLGFDANERTRRCACILHGGSNRSAFSWTNDGLWKCHSCGAGGDKIALVRAVRQCSFQQAVDFLAALAGVSYRTTRVSRQEIESAGFYRERLERAAWAIRDEELRLLSYYRNGLHRSERLMARLSEAPDDTEDFWECLGQLAPAQTFFLAAYTFMCHASREMIVRFVLASPAERRKVILEEGDGDEQRAAA
jgi:DNA primase